MARFQDLSFSREGRYSLGLDTKTQAHFLSIPVSNGIVDYEEYYEISLQEFATFTADSAAALKFADECRRHEHDELLLQKPGWNRGDPT